MSVESIAIALHHSRATGTAKLVLIGIANHDGDGGAWPAVGTLAKYAGCTPRNVKKALRRLEELGEISTAVQGGGLADHDDYTRPNLYTFRLRCPFTCDGSRHHRTRRGGAYDVPMPVDNPGQGGVSVATPGVGSDTGGGVASDTQTTPTNPADSVPASTTDRARPAPAPLEELARVREQLRTTTAAHQSKEHRA